MMFKLFEISFGDEPFSLTIFGFDRKWDIHALLYIGHEYEFDVLFIRSTIEKIRWRPLK